MLDYYTLQKTLIALSNDEYTYTATDIAALCRAGKLTPLFSYNRYTMEEIEHVHSHTGLEYMDFSPETIAPFNGYLTHRKLLDLLDGYKHSIPLHFAHNMEGKELGLVAHKLSIGRYLNDESYSPFSDDDILTVTSEQLLFKREQVEALAGQPQAPQKNGGVSEGQGDTLLILGAVMDCIKEVAKPNYTQQSLINAITDKYKNTSSLTESTLTKKFPKAKKHLNQNVTP